MRRPRMRWGGPSVAALAVIVVFYGGASYGLTAGESDSSPGAGKSSCGEGVVRAGYHNGGGSHPKTVTATKTVTRTAPQRTVTRTVTNYSTKTANVTTTATRTETRTLTVNTPIVTETVTVTEPAQTAPATKTDPPSPEEGDEKHTVPYTAPDETVTVTTTAAPPSTPGGGGGAGGINIAGRC